MAKRGLSEPDSGACRREFRSLPRSSEREVLGGGKPSPSFSLPFAPKGRRLLLRKEKRSYYF